MKILLATDAFYPMINGVVTSTVILYEEMKKLGHEVRILTLSDKREEKFEDDVYYLKSIKVNIYPDARINYLSSSNIVHQIEDWGPEIIHTQTEFSVMIVARKISNRLNIPLIHTYHTMYEDYTNFLIRSKRINKKVVSGVIKQLLGNFSGVIAPTEKTTQTLLRYKVTTPIYTIPTGLCLSKFTRSIDDTEFESLKNNYDLIDKKTLVYLGRISKEKNIDEIINFIALNKDYFMDKRFLIAGGGPYLDTLQKLVKKSNLDNIVKFTGLIEPDEVYKYYKLGNVFVTASTTETQGLTYIEAMATGIPVVCRKDDCVEELVKNNVNGFKYTDEESFIKSIDLVLSDDEHYSTMCFNSKNKAASFSSSTFASSVLNAYSTSLTGFNYNKELALDDEVSLGNLLGDLHSLFHIRRNKEETVAYSKDIFHFSVKTLKDGTLEIKQNVKKRLETVKEKYKS
ncbi:glycosyltransferase [Clostridium grantii]|uniref:1,2-diacylglycerol 3-alpha-glucosyltransferase n=1 Tax=Clostridium grantii DSM 8605 TaxID=1121316 RepID=A0A1M5UQX1_9CLOT|nr:glycosyltransferase [Clostridium grantii]SHH65093.1 1,2-diacylglycerol 3-alpha-glucosyltransferase [Clostridium grantii DSM 8605]